MIRTKVKIILKSGSIEKFKVEALPEELWPECIEVIESEDEKGFTLFDTKGKYRVFDQSNIDYIVLKKVKSLKEILGISKADEWIEKIKEEERKNEAFSTFIQRKKDS